MQLTFQHTFMECVIDKIYETDRHINMESAVWSIHAFDFFSFREKMTITN